MGRGRSRSASGGSDSQGDGTFCLRRLSYLSVRLPYSGAKHRHIISRIPYSSWIFYRAYILPSRRDESVIIYAAVHVLHSRIRSKLHIQGHATCFIHVLVFEPTMLAHTFLVQEGSLSHLVFSLTRFRFATLLNAFACIELIMNVLSWMSDEDNNCKSRSSAVVIKQVARVVGHNHFPIPSEILIF